MTTESTCSVCERQFAVRFRYQTREEAGRFVSVCSQICHQRSLARALCAVCGARFELENPYQVYRPTV